MRYLQLYRDNIGCVHVCGTSRYLRILVVFNTKAFDDDGLRLDTKHP